MTALARDQFDATFGPRRGVPHPIAVLGQPIAGPTAFYRLLAHLAEHPADAAGPAGTARVQSLQAHILDRFHRTSTYRNGKGQHYPFAAHEEVAPLLARAAAQYVESVIASAKQPKDASGDAHRALEAALVGNLVTLICDRTQEQAASALQLLVPGPRSNKLAGSAPFRELTSNPNHPLLLSREKWVRLLTRALAESGLARGRDRIFEAVESAIPFRGN